jgi:hypothetical protein
MSRMNQYIANNLIRLVSTIVTLDGLPVDATSIACKVETSDGVVTDLSSGIIRDSVGKYHVDYLPTIVGLVMYEWIGTGTVEVVGQRQFIVKQGIF